MVSVCFHSLLKQTKLGRVVKPVMFFKYNNLDLCVVNNLTYYVSKTASLVFPVESSLFITYGKPYRKPSRNTIRQWILEMLNGAGINRSTYKAHSTRHVSSSKSLNQGRNLQGILNKPVRQSGSVFRKHYRLPIMTPYIPVLSVRQLERNSIYQSFYDYI